MLNKLKRFPAKKQFEKIEGDFRLVNVAEINELIDSINTELQNVPSPTPYRVYTALLTQIGNTPPVANILQSDIGDEISLGYIDAGTFSITTNLPVFTEGKTAVITGASHAKLAYAAPFYPVEIIDEKTITLYSLNQAGSYTNGLMQDTMVEIRVYN